MWLLSLRPTHKMRLYHCGAAFCKKMRGKLSKMSEKQNSRDHKRRLLAAKFELRRKLYKAFCKDPDLPSDMRDKHRYKLSKLPRNLCTSTSKKAMYFHGSPSWSRWVLYHFSYPFSWISISRSFDGHKEIVLVATTKPIEQGLALQLVHKQGI